MGKIYTEVFKKRALLLLSELNEKRSVKIDKKTITNVRDLVRALGISKDSIYNWRKQITPKKEPEKKKKRKGTIRHEKFKKEQAELLKQKEERLKAKDLEKELERELPSISGTMDIFGGRFVGSIAQAMGISNYSRMKLKQLLLKVGQVYIQKSGLSKKEVK